jgi:hypothetical protein
MEKSVSTTLDSIAWLIYHNWHWCVNPLSIMKRQWVEFIFVHTYLLVLLSSKNPGFYHNLPIFCTICLFASVCALPAPVNYSLHLQTTSPLFLHILTYFQNFSWPSVPVHRDSLLTLLTTFLFLLGSTGSLFLLKTVSCHFLPADFCIAITHPTSCPHMQLIHGREVKDSSSLGKIRTLYNSYCIFPKPDLWLT